MYEFKNYNQSFEFFDEAWDFLKDNTKEIIKRNWKKPLKRWGITIILCSRNTK